MELNQFLFPAPTPSYSSAGFIGEIIYVPKYERDESSGEIIQFTDPKQNNSNVGGNDTARSATVMDPQYDVLQQIKQEAGGFRKQVLGDTAFTKEELALKSIRDEAKQD